MREKSFIPLLFGLVLGFVLFLHPGGIKGQAFEAGNYHSIVLCDNGTVYTCGYNNTGQLGNGSGSNATTVVQVAQFTDVIKVFTGYYHCMVIPSDGTIWAWGINDDGQLGDGTTITRTTPVQVVSLSSIISVDGAADHTMALQNDGSVWTWGSNGIGQLGNGTLISDSVPQQVTGLSGIVEIAAGHMYSLALDDNGSVWAWGNNYFGQLGDGSTTDKSSPTLVSGLSNVTLIGGGAGQSIALLSDSTVWTWGYNLYGQLGDGTTLDKLTPTQVPMLDKVVDVVAADLHTMALKADGTVWTWGWNQYGQLGDGTATNKLSPVQVTGLDSVTHIAGGSYYSMALRSNGTIWVWGRNLFGQLGTGNNSNSNIPIQMPLPCSVYDLSDTSYQYPGTHLTGNVFYDLNSDCLKDSVETGFSGWMVKAEPGPVYGYTYQGNYQLNLDSGNYMLSLIDINNEFWYLDCPQSPFTYSINLGSGPDTVENINFGIQPTVLCPSLNVDIATWALRPCMTSVYSVSYCNQGTVPATNVTIDIELDSNMTFSGSTGNLQLQVGNTYTFNIGTVNFGQCGTFQLYADVSCDIDLIGSTMCVEAHIYPDTSCFPPDSNWDKSSVSVIGLCVNDSLACFTITNNGDLGIGDMQGTSEYRVYENNLLVSIATFQLNGGGDTLICWPANGNTIRLEADQRLGHPGNSNPQDNVELCGGPPLQLGEITIVPMDDQDDFVEIDCRVVTGSFDPNDKQVIPAGYTSLSHFIDSTDQLEYQIRFQNTGTDTAFKVVIFDTLSPFVDITTIRPGVGSHPYVLNILGSNILEWTFDDILLPDSTTNESKSHGFVKFKIDQVVGNPLGTVIENRAGIVFDFNLPVITNTTFNTIGDMEQLTSTSIIRYYRESIEIKVYPNPSSSFTTFEITGEKTDAKLSIELYNILGERILVDGISGSLYVLDCGDMANGVYLYKIIDTEKQKLLASGKLAIN